MGRRNLGSCKCGECAQPLAVGIPYWVWKLEGDYRTAYTIHLQNSPTPVPNPATVMALRDSYGAIGRGCIAHFLEDDEGVLDKAQYFGPKGYGTSKISTVYYGLIPRSKMWNSADVRTRVHVPATGSNEMADLLAYLAQGGTMILCAFPGDVTTHAAEAARKSLDIAKLNTFLADIGAVTRVVTPVEEQARLGHPVVGMGYIYPNSGAWAVNPDTWLTSGMSLAMRVMTYSVDRMYADANRQNGRPEKFGYDARVSYNITDFTGGASTGKDYLRVAQAGYRNDTGGSVYPSMWSRYGSNPVPESLGFMAPTDILLRTSNIQGTALMCFPMANVISQKSPPVVGVHQGTADNDGNIYFPGQTRYLHISATCETLPNGGRIIVTSRPMLEINSNSTFSNSRFYNTWLMQLLKKKLQPSCIYLSEALRSYNV
jgi:hypothetical protein